MADVTLPDHQTSGGTAGRTAWNATRNIAVAVGQAADAFPPLKSVLGGITAILKTYDVRITHSSKIPCSLKNHL